jgi:solute carrier family 25 folate transporter 32
MHWCARRNHQNNNTQRCLISFRWQDHAFAGIGAGTVAVLCMNPLDLLKVKFQVSTSVRAPGGGMGRGIWFALRDIHASEGWRGFYRGLGPNIAGNASSWGLYFLLLRVLPSFLPSFQGFPVLTFFAFVASYNQLKRRATVGSPDRPLSASQYLLYSAEASSHLLLF